MQCRLVNAVKPNSFSESVWLRLFTLTWFQRQMNMYWFEANLLDVSGSSSVKSTDWRRAMRQFYTAVVGNIFPETPPQDSSNSDVTLGSQKRNCFNNVECFFFGRSVQSSKDFADWWWLTVTFDRSDFPELIIETYAEIFWVWLTNL